MKEAKERMIRSLSTREIKKRLLNSQEMRAVLAERIRTIGSAAQKSIVDELTIRLATIRSEYCNIDTSIFPNAVIAKLSQMQGQEKELREQLANWDSIKESQKNIDEAIQLCEIILTERGEQ